MDAPQRQAALERAQQGDAQALGDLLQSYRPYLRVMVHSLRGDRLQTRLDDSDLIQDALLEAHRSFSAFRGSTVPELLAWLRQIVLRSAQRTIRGFVATQKRDLGREETVHGMAELLVDSGSSPSGQAIRHEQAAQMATALARLPEDMQQVLLDRLVDNKPHAQIAERLGRTEQAVRMLYLRALRRLRELYEESG
jgi:RNA polymerase sigma-70 factor (ECF subfamily)